MPIKPENRARYPGNWKEIRMAILMRAHGCCEQCKVPNGERIARGDGVDADTYQMNDANVYCSNTGKYLGRRRMSDFNLLRMVDIVLTVAHLDHTPENCDGMESGGPVLPIERSNLRALCQRCHLRYDAKHHAETARATRRDRLNNFDLFESEPA